LRADTHNKSILVTDAESDLLFLYGGADHAEKERIKLKGRPGFIYSANDKLYLNIDEDIVRLNADTLETEDGHIAGGDVERILLSQDRKLLYVLLSGADTVLMMDAETGEWIASGKAGSNPRDMKLDTDGKRLAIAGGDSNSVFVMDAETLETQIEYPLGGNAVGCMFAGDTLLMLSESGDWEPEPLSLVSAAHENTGEFERLFLLPNIPTCFAFGMNGMLIGHMNGITMVNLQYREVTFRININGLPDLITPMQRFACYIDRLTGRVGVIDCFDPTLIAQIRVPEPAGIAIVTRG
jgi:hypothetical protein